MKLTERQLRAIGHAAAEQSAAARAAEAAPTDLMQDIDRAAHPNSEWARERREAGVVTGREVLAAIAKATDRPAYVEQTGGGTATIYVGKPGDGAYNEWDRYAAAIGPGTFDWADPDASTFYLGDLYIGPDDMGESHAFTASSLAAVTEAVRRTLAEEHAGGMTADGERTDASCPGCGALIPHDDTNHLPDCPQQGQPYDRPDTAEDTYRLDSGRWGALEG